MWSALVVPHAQPQYVYWRPDQPACNNKARPLRCGDATRCCHKHSTRSCACFHVRKHRTRVCMCSFRTYRGPKGQGKAHKEPHHRENDVPCKNLVDDLPKVPFSISPGLTLACTRPAWCSPRERARKASDSHRQRVLRAQHARHEEC